MLSVELEIISTEKMASLQCCYIRANTCIRSLSTVSSVLPACAWMCTMHKRYFLLREVVHYYCFGAWEAWWLSSAGGYGIPTCFSLEPLWIRSFLVVPFPNKMGVFPPMFLVPFDAAQQPFFPVACEVLNPLVSRISHSLWLSPALQMNWKAVGVTALFKTYMTFILYLCIIFY